MVVAGQTATSRNDFANERAKAQDRQNSKRGKRSSSARKGGGVRNRVASNISAEKKGQGGRRVESDRQRAYKRPATRQRLVAHEP